jgi:glutamate synthase (NADPH/NADH) large chain
MSKMGVSTVASYTGAKIFEAVGLSQASSTSTSPVRRPSSAASSSTIAEEVAAATRSAYPRGGIAPAHRELAIGGEYQWRREGEPHLFDPETVFRLQHATPGPGSYDIFKMYTTG